MKVLLISEYFPPIIHGGGEISAEILAEELAKNNVEVHVLTSYFKNLKPYEEIKKVKIHRLLKTSLNPRKLTDNLKRTFLLHSSIKKQATLLHQQEKFDLIHFLNTTSITNLSNLNIKKIATINSYTNFCPKSNLYYEKNEFSPGEKNFIKYIRCMLNADYIGKQKLRVYLKYNPLFLVPFYFNYLKRRNSIKYVDKFIVLNDVVNLNNSRKIYNIIKIKQKIVSYPINLEKDDVLIGYIGELEQIKGIDILIRAFSKTEGARLLIIGSGSEEENLKELCKNLGIEERVIFTGKINQEYLPYIYSKLRIVVLTTRWPEPLSRTLLEALFFGKSIIATKKGGNIEQVQDNVNGFLINDEKELVEKLSLLIKDKELCKQMGKKSREIYEEKFNPDKLIKQVIEFYKE